MLIEQSLHDWFLKLIFQNNIANSKQIFKSKPIKGHVFNQNTNDRDIRLNNINE